jgi:hypothetical protein
VERAGAFCLFTGTRGRKVDGTTHTLAHTPLVEPLRVPEGYRLRVIGVAWSVYGVKEDREAVLQSGAWSWTYNQVSVPGAALDGFQEPTMSPEYPISRHMLYYGGRGLVFPEHTVVGIDLFVGLAPSQGVAVRFTIDGCLIPELVPESAENDEQRLRPHRFFEVLRLVGARCGRLRSRGTTFLSQARSKSAGPDRL